MDDSVILTFLISMVVSAAVYVYIDLKRKPRVRRPSDAPPETPISIGI